MLQLLLLKLYYRLNHLPPTWKQ